jgi:hypothetical protein
VTVPVKVALASGRVDECAAAKVEWIWCDDFETDRRIGYFEYVSEGESFPSAPGVSYAESPAATAIS